MSLTRTGTMACDRRRRRRVAAIGIAVAGLVANGASPTSAEAEFRLPLYQLLASVPVLCETGEEWAADPLAHQISDQAAYTSLGGADRIVLAPQMCLALLLLALDPRGKHDALNDDNGLPVVWLEAQAALALEHEVWHATLRGDDETAAACFARANAADVFGIACVSGARLQALMTRLAEADRLLPLSYYGHAC
jgi:hypothetical protein